MILCPIDHKSVLEVGKALERGGVELRTMRVNSTGVVDIGHLTDLIDAHTRITSIGWVNSEVGTIQPIDAISRACAGHDTLLHADAAQAAARVEIDVTVHHIDALSLSAHKMNGPKGIGALYVSPSARGRIKPIQFGGGQYLLRSGTVPTHLVVGMGHAAELTLKSREESWQRAQELREAALAVLAAEIPDFALNNDPSSSVPQVLNIHLPGITGDSLVAGLTRVALSTGSACTSDSLEPSHVLRGIGLSSERANSCVRLCLDPWMDTDELRRGLLAVCERVRRLRAVEAFSP